MADPPKPEAGVGMEDELEWERQTTTPNPERIGDAGTTKGSADQANGDDAGARRRGWNRQMSTPPQRPFNSSTSPRDDNATGQRTGGKGGRRGNNAPALWYYKDWSGEHGPRTLLDMTKALQKGYFTPTVLVRKEGQERWSTLQDVLDLRHALRSRRAAAFKDELHKKKGAPGGNRQTPGPPGRDKEKATAGGGDALSPTPSPAPAKVDDNLIAQLFKPGGPDWYYIDMQGAVQGPFKSVRMAKWWGNPQYRDHFSTLKCRRGTQGAFKLLSEFPSVPEQPGDVAAASAALQKQQEKKAVQQAQQKALAAEEQVKALEARVEELELENEQLRQSGEDALMLQMQLEQLLQDKTALAAEVSQLKRDKEGLEELLQYAQQFEADEELPGDSLADDGFPNENSAEEDEATLLWLEELRRSQQQDPEQGSADVKGKGAA